MAYTPPSIDKDYGGISAYLDMTKDQHKGMDAKAIIEKWNWGRKPHLNITSLAFLAGVNWQTMDKWLTKLHKEARTKRPRPKKLK